MSSSSGVTAYTWLGFFAFIFSEKNLLPIFKGMAFAKQMLSEPRPYFSQVFSVLGKRC